METEEFYLKIAQSLAGCQLVEQELKLYITEALLLAKKCVGQRMPFKMSGEDYENSSLEKLIGIFRKFSDNAALVAALEAFKKERNFLSHEAIAHCLDFEERLLESSVSEMKPRLETIQREAERLRHAVHEEANKFTVFLAFEALEKP